jgi:N-acetyl sugar amidotransferase
MDTTDPDISFDEAGICNHCRLFEQSTSRNWFPDEEGARKLKTLIDQIKANGKSQPYDCILGLSGGVDSSYLAYKAHEWGLRPLAVHVDAGWNSELAVANIEAIVNHCHYDLHTHVVDWEEMQDLQVAFLKASVANQDVPQDHAFFAALYGESLKFGIRYVLSGGNIATESTMPAEWAYNAMDLRHLRAIHRRFGRVRLRTLPTVNFFQYYFWYPYVKGMIVVRPLNFLPYNKEEAIATLEREIGFRYYGGKHFESRFTKWQQLHYRPTKFGYDERRAYLSSLILSGQMGRDHALAALSEQKPDQNEVQDDADYVRKKLNLTKAEFLEILALPPKTYRDYPSNYALFNIKNEIKNTLARVGIVFRSK